MSDLISRKAVLDIIGNLPPEEIARAWAYVSVSQLPSVEEWIPCSERLPEHNTPVVVTYVNHNPEPYYRHIKDKPFTGFGIYFHGKWFWYTSVLEDILSEYGANSWAASNEAVDGDVEIVAWMPRPEPYRKEKQ